MRAGEGGFLGLGRSDDERERERAIEEIRKRAIVVEKGSSDRTVRRTAMRELPYAKLSEVSRRRVSGVMKNLSLFRKFPTISVPVDPSLYGYFMDNPDVAVSIWRAMKISKFEMSAVGPGRYDAKVDDGTEGKLQVVYRTPREIVVLCNGTFKASKLVRAVSAQAVLHLRTEFGRQRDGTAAVRHRLNMFVSFPSQTVEAAARLISPVGNMIMDRNFQEVSLFLHMMTLLSEQRPSTVVALSDRLEGVTADQRAGLKKVSNDVHRRSIERVRVPAPVARNTPIRRTASTED